VVAERCNGLQIPYRKGIFCSLHRPPLRGVACGLGSRDSPTVCCVLHRVAFMVVSMWCQCHLVVCVSLCRRPLVRAGAFYNEQGTPDQPP
jgi:hypothetical protein